MASQEFLASFAVDIDEDGISRLQQVLEENRELADEVAAAFPVLGRVGGFVQRQLNAIHRLQQITYLLLFYRRTAFNSYKYNWRQYVKRLRDK